MQNMRKIWWLYIKNRGPLQVYKMLVFNINNNNNNNNNYYYYYYYYFPSQLNKKKITKNSKLAFPSQLKYSVLHGSESTAQTPQKSLSL